MAVNFLSLELSKEPDDNMSCTETIVISTICQNGLLAIKNIKHKVDVFDVDNISMSVIALINSLLLQNCGYNL